ncbi:MAG: methyltransferase domain-containing protein [Psychrilyobacter sp.]|uniref:methyltransferase domain-containing protein n=1 Tax=Psychrilyobacter sp. TaxID=2586924 RepID=UPI003C736DEE
MYINEKEKFEKYLLDENKNFIGWSFNYLIRSGRMKEFPLSWNYYNEIIDYCSCTNSLLDMGTGGGEFLSSLTFLPKDTCATEGYEPNIKEAKKRLEPLGISVFSVLEHTDLPIPSKRFSLIINRHESFSSLEVMRILKPRGYFITQQVGGLNDIDLNLLLGADNNQYENWNLNKASKSLTSCGFDLKELKEDKVKTRFYDIGAIIYYLKAIPWQIPDFSVDKYYKQLFHIHKFIEKQGYIDLTCHRFFIIAQKR